MQFEEAAKERTPPLSFASGRKEGQFDTADAIPENVGIRTFTSIDEEGGSIGVRFSDFVGAMPTFSSKGKDIQGHIREVPEISKKRKEIVDSDSESDEDEEGEENVEPPHFEHFLLDNRPELTPEEQVTVRGQKNKEDSLRVY